MRVLVLLFLLLASPARAQDAPMGWLAETIARLTGGSVVIAGLDASHPAAIRMARLELRDAQGIWASAEGVELDWSPLSLARLRVAVTRLAIARLSVIRPPTGQGGGPPGLPLAIAIAALAIDHLVIDPALAGLKLDLGLTGRLEIDRAANATFNLTATHNAGTYHLAGAAAPQAGDLRLSLGETADGLLASRAGFGPVNVRADVRGAWASLAVDATAEAGPLHATLRGLLDARAGTATLDLAATSGPLARAGLSWQTASLTAHIAGTSGQGTLTLDGLALPGLPRQRRMVLKADATTPARIGLTLTSDIAAATAMLDTPARRLTLATLRATLRGQNISLAAPARIDFADGVRVDRLLLASAGASLDLRGRLAPAPDAMAVLTGLPASLFADAEGSLAGQATLKGSAIAARLTGTGLRLRGGPAATLPPGRLDAQIDGTATAARVSARLAAGALQATVEGKAGTALDLAVRATAPLALLDPLLAGDGRRVRGILNLDGRILGTPGAPRPTGTLRLADGEVLDATIGLRIAAIQAEADFADDTLTLRRLTATAGPGRLSAVGTAGAGGYDLHLTANGARLLASDLLTATLDADATLRGPRPDLLTLSGEIDLQQVDIRLPERLPVHLPVLKRRGAVPTASAAPIPLGLDLRVRVPGRITVRGRGLEAELGGSARVTGSALAPVVEGGMALRRGQFSLAGQVLTLNTGRVGLYGGYPPDPTLDFQASTSSGGTTATIAIGGTARQPVVTLSSDPKLPQDEILSQLLLGRSKAQLGPAEIAQIAAAFAQLSDIGSGFDPLETIRARLGLDRLAVGSNAAGQTTLEAGRSVARGVYLGVRQGASPGSSQGTVQFDLGRGIKLQADVGAPAANPPPGARTGSGVGIVWEHEW
jgi:translocation and assembly module TamB